MFTNIPNATGSDFIMFDDYRRIEKALIKRSFKVQSKKVKWSFKVQTWKRTNQKLEIQLIKYKNERDQRIFQLF